MGELTNGELKSLVEIPPEIPDPRDMYIVRIDKKTQLMRREIEQYRSDLVFWMKAHGAEYPGRRLLELDKAMQEIDSV